MRLRVLFLLTVAPLALAACNTNRTAAGTGCNANHNALDGALCPSWEAAGYEPVQENDVALCTRLSVDMLGVRPTAEWIADSCAGRPVYDVVVGLQKTERYRETQRRRWADRFQYNDLIVDVKSIHDLDALVDDLYTEQITYPEFAEEALAHPGFVGRFIGYGQPDVVADAAFRAFLGRPATTPERLDLAALWRPWTLNGGVVVEGGAPPANAASSAASAAGVPADCAQVNGCYYGFGAAPQIDPTACAPGRDCSSSLLGDASLVFPARGRTQFLQMDQLTAEDWTALRTPGRVFAQQPMLWEAEVDDVLKKYLGYDLGSRRPEAREALIHWFQSTNGDVARLERAVLVSWAYRQTATVDPAHPRPSGVAFDPTAYGPTKLMIPEAWLASMGMVTGENVGNADWRYPNLPEWYYPGMYYPGPDGTDQTKQLAQLLRDARYPTLANGQFDPAFRNAAASMGGAPGMMDPASFTPTVRSTQMGLLTAVAQEENIVKMCLLEHPSQLIPGHLDVSRDHDAIERIVRINLERTQGHTPRPPELAAATQAVEEGCPGCSAETVARELCAGMTGGVEFIFY